jgi:hypothetical protein
MATTYEAIATVTVGSGGAANIEFTSIPNSYTDLAVLICSRSTFTGAEVSEILLTFNSVGGTSYSRRSLYSKSDGTGGSNSGSSQANIKIIYHPGALATANTFGNNLIYVPNYASSNNKSVSIDSVAENNAGIGSVGLVLTAGLFSSSSAISSVKLEEANANFAQHSSATLYGIKNS